MKKSGPLNRIHNGAIDYYLGLKIETKLTFEELCGSISQRNSEAIENYNNHIKIPFIDATKQAITECGLEGQLNIKAEDASQHEMQITQSDDLREEICGVEFETTDIGFRIWPRTRLDNYLEFMDDEM